MQHQLGALATCAAVFAYFFLRRRGKPSAIRDVPGPVNPSWIFGTPPGSTPSWGDYTRSDRIPKDTSGISRPKKLEQ